VRVAGRRSPAAVPIALPRLMTAAPVCCAKKHLI
jgi:hypothetical protein